MNNDDMLKILLKYQNKRLSPLKSIKLYCKEVCSCGELLSWKNCKFDCCPLFKYRFAHGNRAKHPEHSSTSENFSKQQQLNQSPEAQNET